MTPHPSWSHAGYVDGLAFYGDTEPAFFSQPHWDGKYPQSYVSGFRAGMEARKA